MTSPISKDELREPIEIRLREIVDNAQVTSHYEEAIDVAVDELKTLITQQNLQLLERLKNNFAGKVEIYETERERELITQLYGRFESAITSLEKEIKGE